jgi:hypothetical protein
MMVEVAACAIGATLVAIILICLPSPDTEAKRRVEQLRRQEDERLRRLARRRAILEKLAREEQERLSRLNRKP